MGIVIFLILVDFFLWWRMLSDLKKRSVVVRTFVIIILSVLTVILLNLIIGMAIYKGEFSEPSNVLRLMNFGSIASLIVTLGVCYILISTITLLLRRIFHRSFTGVIWTNIIIAALITILFADGYFRQRFDFRVVREEVKVSNLDPRLEGMKIVVISDLHIASFFSHYDKLRVMVDLVNSLKPDILVNAGDFISYGWEEFGDCDTILNNAWGTTGSFAVAGNHDDGTYLPEYKALYGIECTLKLKEKIHSSGYTLLTDTSITVTYNGAPVTVSGVVTHGHHLNVSYGDYKKVIANTDTDSFSMLLLHNPVGWDSVLSLPGSPDITLSGHTHGLQAGLPVPGGYISPAAYFHKYWKGMYEKNGKYLFVSTGIGCMGMSERIFMPPEMVLLTLRRE